MSDPESESESESDAKLKMESDASRDWRAALEARGAFLRKGSGLLRLAGMTTSETSLSVPKEEAVVLVWHTDGLSAISPSFFLSLRAGSSRGDAMGCMLRSESPELAARFLAPAGAAPARRGWSSVRGERILGEAKASLPVLLALPSVHVLSVSGRACLPRVLRPADLALEPERERAPEAPTVMPRGRRGAWLQAGKHVSHTRWGSAESEVGTTARWREWRPQTDMPQWRQWCRARM